MKRGYLYLLIIVLSMFLGLTGCGSQNAAADENTGESSPSNNEAVTEATTEEQTKNLTWLTYELKVDELRDVNDEDHLSLKEAPEDSRYVIVKLLSANDEIPMTDITEDTTKSLILKDSAGGEYEPGMWAVSGVKIDADGNFSTDQTQEGFSLVYVVPNSIATDDLSLEVK